MSVALNHTIIPARDKWVSARFLAFVLDLPAGPEWAHFVPINLGNGVTLDFAESQNIRPMHFAFLLGDPEFDAAFERMRQAGIAYYAEWDRTGPGEINRLYGGRGLYFDDADAHQFELITRPYRAIPERWIDGAAVT